MENNFESILASLLEKYEKNPEQDLNALQEDFCKENGVSAEDMIVLKETNEYIDGFAENTASLAKARENDGISRRGWFLSMLDRIMNGRSEKEKADIATSISNSTEKLIENGLKDEEE